MTFGVTVAGGLPDSSTTEHVIADIGISAECTLQVSAHKIGANLAPEIGRRTGSAPAGYVGRRGTSRTSFINEMTCGIE
jgi:hypothetical protein